MERHNEDDPEAVATNPNGNFLQQSNVRNNEGDPEKRNYIQLKKIAVEGLMDIALLTANANQLRFLMAYNYDSNTFYVSLTFIILSLILQVAVGFGLIFKMHIESRNRESDLTNEFLTGGVFIITIINVFAASFTNTNPIAD